MSPMELALEYAKFVVKSTPEKWEELLGGLGSGNQRGPINCIQTLIENYIAPKAMDKFKEQQEQAELNQQQIQIINNQARLNAST